MEQDHDQPLIHDDQSTGFYLDLESFKGLVDEPAAITILPIQPTDTPSTTENYTNEEMRASSSEETSIDHSSVVNDDDISLSIINPESNDRNMEQDTTNDEAEDQFKVETTLPLNDNLVESSDNNGKLEESKPITRTCTWNFGKIRNYEVDVTPVEDVAIENISIEKVDILRTDIDDPKEDEPNDIVPDISIDNYSIDDVLDFVGDNVNYTISDAPKKRDIPSYRKSRAYSVNDMSEVRKSIKVNDMEVYRDRNSKDSNNQ
eukprot:TRINITY_DN5468_c0_g1_i1.p1 TRINITY_DN5468_c0_g1~~TRINITY_DN5468_c0_g1_i1.p1  ORF type:complete len:261 (+),score=91.23 TRINITY_DN5468_c0_g1_i1:2-784(+)